MNPATLKAIQQHGARAVSEAAYAAMNGQRAALERVGLGDVRGLGQLHQITVDAFDAMSTAERTADFVQARIAATRVR